MTDTEAKADVDAMRTETTVVESEVGNAGPALEAALSDLEDLVDTTDNNLSSAFSSVEYIMQHYGE